MSQRNPLPDDFNWQTCEEIPTEMKIELSRDCDIFGHCCILHAEDGSFKRIPPDEITVVNFSKWGGTHISHSVQGIYPKGYLRRQSRKARRKRLKVQKAFNALAHGMMPGLL